MIFLGSIISHISLNSILVEPGIHRCKRIMQNFRYETILICLVKSFELGLE